MIVAELVKKEHFRTVNNIWSYVFTVPSILAGEVSDEIRFDLDVEDNLLDTVKINCLSANYDISCRQIPNVGPIGTLSIEEFLRVVEINQTYYENQLGIYFTNNEVIPSPTEESPQHTNPYFYMLLSNKDAVETGEITFEFMVSKM